MMAASFRLLQIRLPVSPDPTHQQRDRTPTPRPQPVRLTGILRTWHDDRGYGFIAPAHGGREIFVHISQFPRDGSRPTEGERLDYSAGLGRDGKPQALQVSRKALGQEPASRQGQATSHARPTRPAQPTARPWIVTLGLGAAITVTAIWGYTQIQAGWHRADLQQQPPAFSATPTAGTTGTADAPPTSTSTTTPARTVPDHRCDGRQHCSQMQSCEEATWFINHCPGMKMDGDNDGVPCEQELCPVGAMR
jgi:cold shock CspA family protein